EPRVRALPGRGDADPGVAQRREDHGLRASAGHEGLRDERIDRHPGAPRPVGAEDERRALPRDPDPRAAVDAPKTPIPGPFSRFRADDPGIGSDSFEL